MFGKTPSPRIRQVTVGIILLLLGWSSITYSREYNILLHHTLVLNVLGVCFLLAGVMIRILAFKEIPWTHHIENLAMSGIYSKTRNPVYLAFAFIIIGITLLSARLLAFIWVLISLVVFYWLAKKEEGDLEKAFGTDYVRYRKVPMFLPRLQGTSELLVGLEGVNKTLLLPLWARAKESTQENPIIVDSQASRIVRDLDHSLDNMDKALDRYYQLSQVIRAKVIDDEIRAFIKTRPNATIVNVGAGLDTTFGRIDNGSLYWYDLDVPDVIDLRRKFILETERSRCILKSVFDSSWFDDIGRPVHGLLFISCGVLQYFTEGQVRQLFSGLATRFPGSEIVFDTMSKFFLILGNWTVIKKSGMDSKSFMKWGVKSSREITKWDKCIAVVDEYPLFSQVHLDESWGEGIIDKMKQANRMRGLGIFHLRFEP